MRKGLNRFEQLSQEPDVDARVELIWARSGQIEPAASAEATSWGTHKLEWNQQNTAVSPSQEHDANARFDLGR